MKLPTLFGARRDSAGTALSSPRDRPPQVLVEAGRDGAVLLRSPLRLPSLHQSLPHLFDDVARRFPERVFMRQREGADRQWRSITYREAAAASRRLAQGLLDLGLQPGGAVAILSGPSIEHALFMLAAQRCGAAVAPLSVAYSLIASDMDRLSGCAAKAGATIAFADDASKFSRALAALSADGLKIVAARGQSGPLSITRLDALMEVRERDVAKTMSGIRPDTIARIMFTSGSTGSPKATPQTQACLMTTIGQCEALGLLDFGDEGPQHLEAMPFSHIMAGNFNFGNVVAAGGTLWIDEGKPTPQLFGQTLENLRDVAPTFFLTVPIGFTMLCDALEADPALRDHFFSRLAYMGFGGAVLSDQLVRRLDALSHAARGRTTPIYSFYGATEFMFGALRWWWPCERMDVLGLPLPAGDLKLAPVGDKLELRVRGPTVMNRSGYLGDAEISAALFDEEGYFRSGDAVRLLDANDPKQGIVFDGRLAEEFKLATGTFVSVGPLRSDFVSACDPLLREAVICGLNRDEIGVLVWLNDIGARAHVDVPEGVDLAAAPEVQALLRSRVESFNQRNSGSARRIARLLVENAPLSYDSGEITDKGNANQRRVRELREASVQRLFAEPQDKDVLVF